jgi:hypothetical protein
MQYDRRELGIFSFSADPILGMMAKLGIRIKWVYSILVMGIG